jgi:hypothetical protein
VNSESVWVKFMKWAAYLQEKDRKMLYQAGQPPSLKAVEKRWRREEEIKANRRLRQLAASFSRELARCMERLDRVLEDTLKWLSSIDLSKLLSKPFSRKQEAVLMDRYTSC